MMPSHAYLCTLDRILAPEKCLSDIANVLVLRNNCFAIFHLSNILGKEVTYFISRWSKCHILCCCSLCHIKIFDHLFLALWGNGWSTCRRKGTRARGIQNCATRANLYVFYTDRDAPLAWGSREWTLSVPSDLEGFAASTLWPKVGDRAVRHEVDTQPTGGIQIEHLPKIIAELRWISFRPVCLPLGWSSKSAKKNKECNDHEKGNYSSRGEDGELWCIMKA